MCHCTEKNTKSNFWLGSAAAAGAFIPDSTEVKNRPTTRQCCCILPKLPLSRDTAVTMAVAVEESQNTCHVGTCPVKPPDRQVTAKPLTNISKQIDPGWSRTRADRGLQLKVYASINVFPQRRGLGGGGETLGIRSTKKKITCTRNLTEHFDAGTGP